MDVGVLQHNIRHAQDKTRRLIHGLNILLVVLFSAILTNTVIAAPHCGSSELHLGAKEYIPLKNALYDVNNEFGNAQKYYLLTAPQNIKLICENTKQIMYITGCGLRIHPLKRVH